MTGILTEQILISDCRYRVIESSSLVPILFSELFSHPYISFFYLLVNGFSVIYICLLHTSPAHCISMMRSMRYQPISHTLYYTLHTEHAHCLSYRFFNNVVKILDGRLGKRSVERVRYVINNLLHLVVVVYGDISLVLCISTRLWLVTILSLLMKYLVIFHADPCNKSHMSSKSKMF